MRHAKTFALFGGCVLAGMVGVLVVLGFLELYKDWSFLHTARKITEEQLARPVAQPTAPQAAAPKPTQP